MKLFEVVIVAPNKITKGTFTEDALEKMVKHVNVNLAISKKQHTCAMINAQTGESSTVHIKLLD